MPLLRKWSQGPVKGSGKSKGKMDNVALAVLAAIKGKAKGKGANQTGIKESFAKDANGKVPYHPGEVVYELKRKSQLEKCTGKGGSREDLADANETRMMLADAEAGVEPAKPAKLRKVKQEMEDEDDQRMKRANKKTKPAKTGQLALKDVPDEADAGEDEAEEDKTVEGQNDEAAEDEAAEDEAAEDEAAEDEGAEDEAAEGEAAEDEAAEGEAAEGEAAEDEAEGNEAAEGEQEEQPKTRKRLRPCKEIDMVQPKQKAKKMVGVVPTNGTELVRLRTKTSTDSFDGNYTTPKRRVKTTFSPVPRPSPKSVLFGGTIASRPKNQTSYCLLGLPARCQGCQLLGYR